MTDTQDTSPEAVERAIGMCRAHGLHGTEATLRALSAALLDVSKREAAMMARYDAKLEAADVQLTALKAELADAVEIAERLCKEASITSKLGAVTGSHWTHLGMAILKTRAFLARHQKEADT